MKLERASRGFLVLACAVLGLIGAFATKVIEPQQYAATAYIYLKPALGVNPYSPLSAQDQLKLDRDTLQNIATAASNEITAARLDPRSEASQYTIEVSSTSTFRVVASSQSPNAALSVANLAAHVSARRFNDLESPLPTAITPRAVPRATVVEGTLPLAPSSTGLSVTLALGLIAGATVGALGFVRIRDPQRGASVHEISPREPLFPHRRGGTFPAGTCSSRR